MSLKMRVAVGLTSAVTVGGLIGALGPHPSTGNTQDERDRASQSQRQGQLSEHESRLQEERRAAGLRDGDSEEVRRAVPGQHEPPRFRFRP